jgi:hypothetical protein
MLKRLYKTPLNNKRNVKIFSTKGKWNYNLSKIIRFE